jgi:hypothetical protein
MLRRSIMVAPGIYEVVGDEEPGRTSVTTT